MACSVLLQLSNIIQNTSEKLTNYFCTITHITFMQCNEGFAKMLLLKNVNIKSYIGPSSLISDT